MVVFRDGRREEKEMDIITSKSKTFLTLWNLEIGEHTREPLKIILVDGHVHQ